MLNARVGTVAEVISERKGIQRLKVEPDDAPESARRAVNFPDLCGPASIGDRVLLNTTAVDLNLGTGGWDFVMANLSLAEKSDRQTFGEATTGHLMKLRYAPHQMALLAAEEDHPDLPETLEGRPVIVMELHSQIAPTLIGLKQAMEIAKEPYPRVAYLMPDTAALPLALSDTIPQLEERGLIHATITCGHAFGGDYEAVNVGSGLAIAAGPANADVIMVAQGPGNAGTGSKFGFGGLFQAEAVHLAHALHGDPILVARASNADPRPRHQGISHHTNTLLDILLAPVTLPMPDGGFNQKLIETKLRREAVEVRDPVLPEQREYKYAAGEPVPRGQLSPEQVPTGELHPEAYKKFNVTSVPDALLYLALQECGLPLRSMGRGLDEDPFFFLAAAAAGWVAGKRHLRRHRPRRENP